MTLIASAHPSDELYARVSKQFDQREMVALTLRVTMINAWNRFAMGFCTPPETAGGVLAQLRVPAAS